MALSPQVVVVGSVNEDHVLVVEALPRPGETVLALASSRSSGGKGANQAVAAARAGTPTQLVAALGSDASATWLRSELEAHGVQGRHLDRLDGPSGTAIVVVDHKGDNSIVVDPGANGGLTPDFVRSGLVQLKADDVLLLQCEVPADTLRVAVNAGAAAGARVVLNWSPVVELPDDLVKWVDILVVNRGEARTLVPGHADTAADDLALASALADRYSVNTVVTLGARGAVCCVAGHPTFVRATSVASVIDSTGAGDTFAGTLAAAIAQGDPLDVATSRACMAASLSVMSRGAQPAPDPQDQPIPAAP